MGKLLFFVPTVLLIMVFIFTFPNGSLSQDSVVQNVAKNIFNDKTLTLPSNVKNFVILIPNEAHEFPLFPK
jgi:hypothetical protein